MVAPRVARSTWRDYSAAESAAILAAKQWLWGEAVRRWSDASWGCIFSAACHHRRVGAWATEDVIDRTARVHIGRYDAQ